MTEIYYKNDKGEMILVGTVPADTVGTPPPSTPEPTPTPEPPTTPEQPRGTDEFGTSVIYPTVAGGRVWNSTNFSTGANNRTLTGGVREGDMITEGNSKYIIIPTASEMQFSGPVPRLYVYDAGRTKYFENIEVTAYYKMVSYMSGFQSGYQGFEIGTRGQHEMERKSLNVETYYIRHSLNGNWWRLKEDVHPKSNDVTVNKGVAFDLNKWYGMKAIFATLPNGNVRLQSYRDVTDGANGGTWTKMSDFTDTGNWAGKPAYSSKNSDCKSVLFRSDNVNDFRIKKLTIRQIDPATVN